MSDLKERITKEYLAKLNAISFRMQQKIGRMGAAGNRKSIGKGSSMEFSDFREYMPGDDLRRLDWNGYARFDRLFMKLFIEERQATVNIFLDTSKSMALYEEKAIYSKLLAASLAYITLANTDRVNLFLITDMVIGKKMRLSSKNLFPAAVDFLEGASYEKETKLCKAVAEAAKEDLGSGISVVISDFFSEDGYQNAIKTLQYKKQDVILVQVLDILEKSPKAGGFVRLVDYENGGCLDVSLTASYIREYKRALEEYEKELQDYCFRTGTKFVGLSTDTPLLKCPLFSYLS